MSLKKLDLYKLKTTGTGLVELQKVLPRCEVFYWPGGRAARRKDACPLAAALTPGNHIQYISFNPTGWLTPVA